mmetsp:Transcript_28020/g.45999  ORF Transcript_28020/g.45999 Transcript_28020/m.45999 type:complete len:89 (-) Transcript_28020:1045-1311(-)
MAKLVGTLYHNNFHNNFFTEPSRPFPSMNHHLLAAKSVFIVALYISILVMFLTGIGVQSQDGNWEVGVFDEQQFLASTATNGPTYSML